MLGREWNFRVALRTTPGEHVGVVGDCEQLGKWDHENGIILTRCLIDAADGLVFFHFTHGHDLNWLNRIWY